MMNLCGAITNAELRERVARLATSVSWSCWLTDSADVLLNMLPALTPSPDAVLSDDPTLFSQLKTLPATGIYLTRLNEEVTGPPTTQDPDPNPSPSPETICDSSSDAVFINTDCDDLTLLQHLHDCINARRFRQRFDRLDHQEPITELPRHLQLFQSLTAFRQHTMGLLIIQLDHAEYLYGSLDPVSKTDLLHALARHLKEAAPASAELGFYDAACFMVALPDTTKSQTIKAADSLTRKVRQPLTFRGGEIHLTVSIGHNHAQRFRDFESLWNGAWQAMSRAAESGGDRVEAAPAADISSRLPEALEEDEFTLALQAQWHNGSRQLSGVEALLRWQGMEVGNLAPSHFIPIAEEQGFMSRIGDWVMEQACREASTWFEHLIDPLWLCINVSPAQFVNRAITRQIARLRKERWLDPSMLELELSHASFLHLVDEHRDQLYELRNWGVRFAIDNLGKDLIEAEKLLRCPADTLKIDRALIANMPVNPATRDLVDQICALGERFRLRVVAVGVETRAQQDMLSSWPDIDVQGYLLSPPVPIDDFRQLLSDPLKSPAAAEGS